MLQVKQANLLLKNFGTGYPDFSLPKEKNCTFVNCINKDRTMANDEMKQIWKVPEPTLRRLPLYLAFLKLMKGRGETFVSSTQISKEINVDPRQVAKEI